jgi:predicted dehydrogenase
MRIGIIGLGSIGLRHARNARALDHDVTAFDPDESRRTLFAQDGGTATADEDAVFGNNDAVIICSPNRFHLAHLRRAVDAGIHALVEKPLSHTLDGLSAVLDAADSQKLSIGVAMNLRFHPVAVTARDIVRSAAYGRPLWARFTMSSYLPSWRPHQDYRAGYTADREGGGILLDDVHEPDLACFILGTARTAAASAHNTGALEITTEDCADIVLDHGTARSVIHMDYVSRHKRRFFEIQCENAFIHGDLIKRHLTVYGNENDTIRDEQFAGSFDDDYINELKTFIASISGTAAYPAPARESVAVLSCVLDAHTMAGLPGATS